MQVSLAKLVKASLGLALALQYCPTRLSPIFTPASHTGFPAVSVSYMYLLGVLIGELVSLCPL